MAKDSSRRDPGFLFGEAPRPSLDSLHAVPGGRSSGNLHPKRVLPVGTYRVQVPRGSSYSTGVELGPENTIYGAPYPLG